jgi:hypothetical protein
MGKKGNKRKRTETESERSLERRQLPVSKTNVSLPPPFPCMTPFLKTCFLRNNDPKLQDMYQLALNTAFEGFSCDVPPEASSYFNERDIQKALNTLQKYNWFRTDVTQPYGLGSP